MNLDSVTPNLEAMRKKLDECSRPWEWQELLDVLEATIGYRWTYKTVERIRDE